MAAAASVNGIEYQRTVRLLPHGGAGICARRKAGGHDAVFSKAVQRTHGVLHIVPALVRSRNAQGHGASRLHTLQRGAVVCIRLRIGGQHDLSRLKRRDRALLHALHPGRYGPADSEAALLNGADHVHTGLRCAGGMLSVKIVGIEENAAVGPGLVHRRHRADNLGGRPKSVIHRIAEISGNTDRGLSQNRGAIGAEADSIVPGVAAAEHPVRHHKADGKSRIHIVEIAVDARHNAVALRLQSRGHIRHAGTVRQHIAIGDNGRHRLIGRVGNEIFRPQIGIRLTPEHIGGKLRFPVNQGVLCGQVLPHCRRSGSGQRQCAEQAQRQQQRCELPNAYPHKYLLCSPALCRSVRST